MMARTLVPVSVRREWSAVSLCAAVFVVLAGTLSYGQKPDDQKVAEALKRVQQWQLHRADLAEQIFDVTLLGQAGATQAISPLKEEFSVTKHTGLKLAIASVLVTFGEKDVVYWDFLADEARKAVENDAPSIVILDSKGRVTRSQGQLPPEFIAWARDHNLDPAAAAQAQVYEIPANLAYLAKTGDPRGRELLRLGLKSHNLFIQSIAARGLAKLQDKDSIPLIIAACKAAPLEGASLIARALPFFDDPRARSAAEQFISDKQVLEYIRSRIRAGAGPFSL